MEANSYNHWQLQLDEQQILWLSLDKANASTNTLNEAIFSEFEVILNNLPKELKGLVIQSAKRSGFIAGADIEQFTQLSSEAEALQLIQRGQKLFNQLASLPLPTVALVKGFCLGGGLELALACRYIVAAEGPKTRLGLPEVMLGIHPGWGGSVRLPRRIGALAGMDLILSGRAVSAKAAFKLGFVDAAVPERQLVRTASYFILNQPKTRSAHYLLKLSNHRLLRPLIAKILYHKLKQKVRQAHYPAPFAIVNNWLKHGVEGEQAFLAEAQSLAKLQQHESAKNLVRVFFLQERLKAQAKNVQFNAQHVHVIGAGTMGGDIAAWCALKGMTVTLQDREPQLIAPAIKRAYGLFKKKLKDRLAIQAAMDRLQPDPLSLGVKRADVIIEAIYENLAAKQALFKDLAARMKPGAILATNTSSIPLDEINTVLAAPEQLVGIHFFNPVAKMMLVEVVQGQQTSPEIVQQAIAFVRQLDKLPLPVKSSPGFLVNRVLMPYLMECMRLLEEGVAAVAIDEAALEFGMPMGPVELADTVGLDVCLSVANNLTQHLGGQVPDQLRKLVEKGELGCKTGKGFYVYKQGKALKEQVPAESTLSSAAIAERLVQRLIDESKACLSEGVVNDADLLDAGMIFGTGFAPFRGGPLHYEATRQLLKV